MTDLPVNVDGSYADDATHPDVKLHQQHHDVIHFFYNLFGDAVDDIATWPDGGIPFWQDSNGEFVVIDPAIAGSPGPTGEQGVGFLMMGPWNSGTTYHVYTFNTPDTYELVTYTGSVWYAKTTHSNSAPSLANTTNWGLFAAAGTNGTNGADGAQGQTGPIGATGAPGPSRESIANAADVEGAITLDAGENTGYSYTLTDDATFTLADTSGSEFSAITLRLYMGPAGPFTADFPDVQFWNTEDGNPPSLAAMNDGDVLVVVFDQMFGDWFGHSRAAGGPPAPEIIPTLDLDTTAFIEATDTTNLTTTVGQTSTSFPAIGGAVQVGNKRGAVVLVVQTRGDSVDPDPPSALTGGGATWVQGISAAFGTGTTRRRGTLFFARDAVSGPAAPFVITTPHLSTPAAQFTGRAVYGFRTAGIVADTWVALADLKGVARSLADGAPGTSTNVVNTLGAASNAANRPIWFTLADFAADMTVSEARTLLTVAAGVQMTSPTLRIWAQWDDTTFDASMVSTLSVGAAWLTLGTEMEQG